MGEVQRSIRLEGALHVLTVTNSRHEDSLVKGGQYLAGIMLEDAAGNICHAALTYKDVYILQDYLNKLLDQTK